MHNIDTEKISLLSSEIIMGRKWKSATTETKKDDNSLKISETKTGNFYQTCCMSYTVDV